MLAIGQDPEVARVAAPYLQLLAPAYLFFTLAVLNKTWMLCLRTPHVSMVSQIVATVLYFPIVYLLVEVKQLGIAGLGLSFLIHCLINLIISTVWMSCFIPEFK